MQWLAAWILLLGSSGGEDPPPAQDELLFRSIAESLAAEFEGEDLGRVSRALRRIADEMDAAVRRRESLRIGDAEAGILAYLLQRYDADGDGAVVSAEYARGEERFRQLDSNEDGRVDDRDIFGGFRSGRQMRAMLDSMALSMFFNADDDTESLTWDELVESFDRSDLDEDGLLTEEEFRSLEDTFANSTQAKALGQGLGGGGRSSAIEDLMADPYPHLARIGDKDEADWITKDALLEYFDEHDEDLDGVLDTESVFPGGDGQNQDVVALLFGKDEEPEEVVAYDGTVRGVGAPEGEPAPDFTLKGLHGGATVTLSSFRDQKPVALIFGSYT